MVCKKEIEDAGEVCQNCNITLEACIEILLEETDFISKNIGALSKYLDQAKEENDTDQARIKELEEAIRNISMCNPYCMQDGEMKCHFCFEPTHVTHKANCRWKLLHKALQKGKTKPAYVVPGGNGLIYITGFVFFLGIVYQTLAIFGLI